MIALWLAAVPACGDDDGGTNQNNSNVTNPVCGNGVMETGETCDEGAANSDSEPNACRTTCRPAYCGDGTVDTGEVCDDGNVAAGDGCSATCTVETGWDCTGSACLPICGDDLAVGAEPCDGSDLRGETCISVGQAAGELRCNALCMLDISWCTGGGSVCGNGDLEPGEACDDGNVDRCDGCSSTCTIEACGNATVDCLEDCDTGGQTASCDADCTLVECGDCVVNTAAGEACDDGNEMSGDGAGLDRVVLGERWEHSRCEHQDGEPVDAVRCAG